MIDVARNNSAPAGYFLSNKFGGDFARDGGTEALTRVLVTEVGGTEAGSFAVRAGSPRPPGFADGDELHLGGDDALPCIPKLADRMACACAERTTLCAG